MVREVRLPKPRPLWAPATLALALGALLAALAGTPGPAQAGSPFDGRWLVVIRSAAGACDTAGGYALHIRNGRVSYRGLAPISVRGRVDRRGRVTVRLHGGDRWAQAAGRLSKNAGTGTWHGRSHRRACTGRWRARRH